MLVQSMVGFQLDNLKKHFQPIAIPLKKFQNPREAQCLGFNLTNIMVKINKGFIQVNSNYIRLNQDQVDTEFCETFEQRIANSPMDIFKKIASIPLFDNPMMNAFLKGEKGEKEDTKKIDD